MTYGHLRADCLYTGISSGHNARYRVWEAFTFTFSIDEFRNVSVTVTVWVMVGVVAVGVVDTRYGVSQPGADAER